MPAQPSRFDTPGPGTRSGGHRRGRRHFLAAGGALLVASMAAEAQRSGKMPRIGFVSPTARGRRDEAFVQGLHELGYVDGRSAHLEMRFADGQAERLPALVDEVLGLRVDVLVVGATIGARAAKRATRSIPVVFAAASDPVAGGVVSNLARPEANLTGTSLAIGEAFAGKWLELLREAAPGISRVAILWSSSNAAAARFVKALEAAARKLDVTVEVRHAANPAERDRALAAIAGGGAQGLIVTPSPFAAASQGELVAFAAERRMPAIYFVEDFADRGGLMSYGPSIADAYRRAASYVHRILEGARPGELPVEQPTRFELVINLTTARALGLRVPQSLLQRADRVIE